MPASSSPASSRPAPINPSPSHQKFALVTGAGSGLGQAYSLQLAREGWHVGVSDVDLAAAEATCAQIEGLGGSGEALRLDVTQFDQWQALIQQLRTRWPRLDLLINNAGICAAGQIGQLPLDDFQAVMQVNFQGVLNGCQAVVGWLKESAPGGHVVNVASIFGLVAAPSMGAYNVSKAAVVALSETLYGELHPLGIGVTVVAPGFFRSQLIARGRFAEPSQRQLAQHYLDHATISAEQVVQQTLRAIGRPQLYVVLGSKARWIWRLKRWMPSWFAGMLLWRAGRVRRSISADD